MNGHETELCELCGSEFDVGYWRRDRNWCDDCLSLADEPATASRRVMAISDDDLADEDDWADTELPNPIELGLENHTSPIY